MTELVVDGYMFYLIEGSPVIYVYQDDRFVTDIFCITYEKAIKTLESIRSGRYRLMVEDSQYKLKKVGTTVPRNETSV